MWHRLRTLWRNLAHKRAVDDDLTREIHSYETMLANEKSRAGMDPETARRAARLEMEGLEQIKEKVRDVRLGIFIETICAELRQSLRGLNRNKDLWILGSTMLALGIGATTVVFSIFYATLIQPLPFRDANRLVQLKETRLSLGIDKAEFSEANFWDVRALNHSFTDVAAFHYDEANLTGDGPAEKVTDRSVTTGFFRTLGVSPVLGRDFSATEDRNGFNNGVVILGDKFWRNRFGADPKIIGRTLRLNDRVCVVIGVLPPGEPWINDQIYQPFGYRANADRASWEFSVIGRLAPGVSLPAATADLKRVAAQLDKAYPGEDRGIGFSLLPANRWRAGDKTRRALWVLLGSVSFLLFIACLNIANLLLARGTARRREIAVRIALGAGRARLIRFVMMESLLLSLGGSLLGLLLAFGTLRALQTMKLDGMPRLAEATLNPWVLVFAITIALVTGVLSGLVPALQIPATGAASAMRAGDHQTGSREQGRLRAILVAAEVALSFLLLVGAGLLIRSFTELLSTDSGFHTEHRLVFAVSMPQSYDHDEEGKQFLDRFLERLSSIPEVIAAGGISSLPVAGPDTGMGIVAVSAENGGTPRTPPWAGWRIVSPGYFRAVGLPLLRGRAFDERDKPIEADHGQAPSPRHVVLSQRLAKLLFGDKDALGKRVDLWANSNFDAEVVGIVADSRERGPSSGPSLTAYLPYGRNALVSEFVLHTRGNPLAVAHTVRAIVGELNPALPVTDVRSFAEVVHDSLSPQRFNVILLASFASLALLLATTGIYGVLAYAMNRSTTEIGLRLALGASRKNILGSVLWQGMRPALTGMLLGAMAAWWLSRYLETLLFGVKPFDVLTYLAVAALLLMTAVIACLLPGRRAIGIDPAVALRTE